MTPCRRSGDGRVGFVLPQAGPRRQAYHAPVRRWLLVFLVLLLPLRGWVGEAMAGQMQEQRLAAAAAQQEHGAGHGHHHAGGHHADDEAAALSGDAHHEAAAPAAASNHDCGTCASCQACSSFALSPSLPVIPAAGFSQPRPQSPQRAYTSVAPDLAFKPPRG